MKVGSEKRWADQHPDEEVGIVIPRFAIGVDLGSEHPDRCVDIGDRLMRWAGWTMPTGALGFARQRA